MKRFFSLCLLGGAALTASAQDAAQTSNRLQQQIGRHELQQQITNLRNAQKQDAGFKTNDDRAAEAKPTREELQSVLPVKYLVFTESRVVPASLLADLRTKYEGKTLSIADIKAITAAVNTYYREHGYITSRAYVPEQDAASGTLTIRLFEGTIGKVSTTGLKHTKEAYVTRAVGMKSGTVFCAKDIEQDLTEFNMLTDLKARLNISPGNAAGSSDMELVAQEDKRFSAVLFTDNAGQKTTGLYRGGVFASARGLASTAYTRDILTAGFVGSEGSRSYSGSYAVTENTFNTTWSLSLNHSDTDVVTKDLKDMNIDSKYSELTLGVRQPLYVTGSNVFAHGLEFGAKENETEMLGYLKTNNYRTNTLRYTLDDLWVTERGYLYNAATLSRGWQVIENGKDFWRFTYRAEGQYKANSYISFTERLFGQLSSLSEMQSSEEIQLGGVNSVRGYEEGMLNGERGYASQTELRLNLKTCVPKAPSWVQSAEAFAFFDCGQLTHAVADDTLRAYNEAFLSSAGWGLRFGFTEHFSMSGTMAMPLKKHVLNTRDNKPHWLYALNLEY